MHFCKKLAGILVLSLLIIVGSITSAQARSEAFDGVHLYILVNRSVFEPLAPDDAQALVKFAYRILDANPKNKVSVIEGNASTSDDDYEFGPHFDDHRLKDHIKLSSNGFSIHGWDLSDSLKVYEDLLKRHDARLKNILLLIDTDGGLSQCYEKYSIKSDPYRQIDEGMAKGFTRIMKIYNAIPGPRDVYTIQGRIGAPADDFTVYLNNQEAMITRMLHEGLQNCGTGFSGFAGNELPPLNAFGEDILKMNDYKQPVQNRGEGQKEPGISNNDLTAEKGNESIENSRKSIEGQPFINPFTDVSREHWFYNAVRSVYERNLMSGTDSKTFSPNKPMTRAQMARIMYNMGNGDTKDSKYPIVYNDVASDFWAANAIGWAQNNGIIIGYEDGRFGPDDNVTREQAVVIFYRYLRVKDSSAKRSEIDQFVDNVDVSDYAVEAMAWSAKKGLINGDASKRLNPKASIKRSEMAQILNNLSKMKEAENR